MPFAVLIVTVAPPLPSRSALTKAAPVTASCKAGASCAGTPVTTSRAICSVTSESDSLVGRYISAGTRSPGDCGFS